MTTANRRDFHDVLRAMRAGVDEYGRNWVDPLWQESRDCQYAFEHEGQTRHCIVGFVFQHLGGNVVPHQCSVNIYLRDWSEELGLKFTDKAKILLRFAQALQDGGMPWGYVYDAVYQLPSANRWP